MKEVPRNGFSDRRLKKHKYVKVEGMKIPVTILKDHLESYKILNRKKDIQKVKEIEQFLKNPMQQ